MKWNLRAAAWPFGLLVLGLLVSAFAITTNKERAALKLERIALEDERADLDAEWTTLERYSAVFAEQQTLAIAASTDTVRSLESCRGGTDPRIHADRVRVVRCSLDVLDRVSERELEHRERLLEREREYRAETLRRGATKSPD